LLNNPDRIALVGIFVFLRREKVSFSIALALGSGYKRYMNKTNKTLRIAVKGQDFVFVFNNGSKIYQGKIPGACYSPLYTYGEDADTLATLAAVAAFDCTGMTASGVEIDGLGNFWRTYEAL
jgi:hypothetical protein